MTREIKIPSGRYEVRKLHISKGWVTHVLFPVHNEDAGHTLENIIKDKSCRPKFPRICLKYKIDLFCGLLAYFSIAIS